MKEVQQRPRIETKLVHHNVVNDLHGGENITPKKQNENNVRLILDENLQKNTNKTSLLAKLESLAENKVLLSARNVSDL